MATSTYTYLVSGSSTTNHVVLGPSSRQAGQNLSYFSVVANSSSDMNGSQGGDVATEGDAYSQEVLQMTTFVLNGCLGILLVTLGLLGNTMSIVVLCNRRMRSSTSYYLTSLAVYDNFVLVANLLFFDMWALGYKVPGAQAAYNSYVAIIPVGYPISLMAQMGSIYTCVAFTIERFIAVCRPLHAAKTCTKSRAKRAILLILLWSLVYNIPRCFHYRATTVWRNATQTHEVELRPTEFGSSEAFRHVYIIYFQLLFMFLVPFLVILVLNAVLVKAIERSRHQRQQMSVTATREHNLTVMLVAVIVVFLVCQLLTVVDNILVAAVGEEKHDKMPQYQMVYTVSTFLVTVNSSVNFMLYCLFGKKFRMVLCHILGMQPTGRGGPPESQYNSTIYQSRINGGGGGGKVTQCHTYDVEVSLV